MKKFGGKTEKNLRLKFKTKKNDTLFFSLNPLKF